VHPFFTGHAAPAASITVSRRSNRSIRPSARITDPNNVMNNSGLPANAQPSSSVRNLEKRKAPDSMPTRRVVQKVIMDSESECQTDGDDNSSRPTRASSEVRSIDGVHGEFEELQALADDNHQVRSVS
jgi:hypothetical protein